MMRKELGAAIIACMLAASVAPVAAQTVSRSDDAPTIQDIVELARQERARREAVQAARENRVFTTADVERYVPPAAEAVDMAVSDAVQGGESLASADLPGGEAGDLSADVAADQEPGTTPEEEWLAWQEEVIGLRNEIQILDDRRVALQLQMTDIRGKVTAPTGTLQDRNRALADLAVAQSSLDETNAELEAAAMALETLLRSEPPRPE